MTFSINQEGFKSSLCFHVVLKQSNCNILLAAFFTANYAVVLENKIEGFPWFWLHKQAAKNGVWSGYIC